MDSERMALVAVGIVAVILQLLLGPVMAIGTAAPNFIAVAVIVLVMLSPAEPHYVFAFTMGMAADLTGHTPVGSTALALLACAYVLPMVVEMLGNDNVLMTALILAVTFLAFELVSCIFLAIAGLAGLFEALAALALPCALYNAVIAFIVFVVASRVIASRPGSRGGSTMSNVRFN